MRRSVWFAVLMTALVLFAAGLAADGENRAAIAGGMEAAVSSIARSGIVRAIGSTDVLLWIGGIGGLLVLTHVGRRGSRIVRGHGTRRSRTIVLARQGRSISGIARRHGMAQDAVRAMVRAETAPVRRNRESGKSFRSAAPSFASVLRSRLRATPETHYE